MKILTRLTILWFLVLSGVTAGSVLVFRNAMREGLTQEATRSRQEVRQARARAQLAHARTVARAVQQVLVERITARQKQFDAISSLPIWTQPAEGGAQDEIQSVLALLRISDLLAVQILEPSGAPRYAWALSPQVDVPGHGGSRSVLDPVDGPTLGLLPELHRRALEGASDAWVGGLTADAWRLLGLPGDAPKADLEAACIVFTRPLPGEAGVLFAVSPFSTDWLRSWIEPYSSEGVLGLTLAQDGIRLVSTDDAFPAGTHLDDEWLSMRGAPPGSCRDLTDGVLLNIGNSELPVVTVLEAHPLDSQDEREGIQTLEPAPHQMRYMLSQMGILAIVGLVLGVLGTQQVSRSIRRLRRRAEQVSTGQLDLTFKDLSGSDDVGELARSFERLRISLRKLMDKERQSKEAGGEPGGSSR